MNRLKAGYCKTVNPYNQAAIYRIGLTPEAVDGFVFWTKNIGPFLKHLKEIKARGYPFIVQHTINGYPRELESRVIDYAVAVDNMKRLADEYGISTTVWRYDPIIISSLTTIDWHRDNFEQLARNLAGSTNEVVVSFAQIYKKTKSNMNQAANEFNFTWDAHEAMIEEERKKFLVDLATIAKSHSIQMKICAQKAFIEPGLIEEAHCVDVDRLESVSHELLRGDPDRLEKVSHSLMQGRVKQKGNRKECACFAFKDIGAYDTCPHGCVYCYAVQNRDKALQRYKDHNPTSEFLFAPENYTPDEGEETKLSRDISAEKLQKSSTRKDIFQEKLF